jgi:hypothetical protein
VDPTIAVTVICRSVYATLDIRIHLTSLPLPVDGRRVHVRATAAIRRIIGRADVDLAARQPLRLA